VIKLETVTTSIRDWFETNLPPLLTARSLDQIEEYLTEHVENPSKRTLAVYIADADDVETELTVIWLVQVQLPAVLNVQDYFYTVWDDLFPKLNADLFGFNILDPGAVIDYPGQWGGGGAGGFVYFQLKMTKVKDSCDFETS
jgi:hypothetical protein